VCPLESSVTGELSEEDLRLVSELGPLLGAIASPEGYFVWLSSRWEALLGWSPEEMMSRPLLDFVHPDDQQSSAKERERMRVGGSISQFVNRYRDVNGTWVSLEWSARRAPGGRIFAAARDVTAQRAAEARRQQLVGQLHQAEALAALGHWRVDVVNQTVFWSPQVFAIHGRDPALGPPPLQTAINYYHPDDRAAVQAALDHSIATREPFRFQLRIVRDDGVERIVESRGDVEADRRGALVGIFGVFQDITEQSLLQKRLRHMERLGTMGSLATGVAHEINNPLTYVIGNAHLLKEQLGELAGWMPNRQLGDLSRLASEIHEGAERIARIVRGLRGMGGPETGRETLVDLRLAVAMARRTSEMEWRYRAQVLVDLPEDLPLVRGGETQVQQLLLNLIVNAAHATPEGRPDAHRIRVTAGRRGPSGVWLEVQDDGLGMSPDVLARATDPFFTTKMHGAGTGLGLYLVQGFVGGLGGELSIRSPEGLGTTVRLELPGVLRPEGMLGPAAERAPASAPEPAGLRARVHIIDDEPRVARAIARMLSPHDVVVFTDPEDALRAIEQGDVPDVILCDLMMQPLTGPEVYAALPEALRGVFWVVTGGGVTAATRRFQREMGDRVLLKPPEQRVLREIVAGVLAGD
jgi:PAS domain S-box-containing protein